MSCRYVDGRDGAVVVAAVGAMVKLWWLIGMTMAGVIMAYVVVVVIAMEVMAWLV